VNDRVRSNWSDYLVVIGYVLLSMVYLWPLVRRFGTAVAGDGFDRYVFQWTNWWVTRALTQGQSPYHTQAIFHPHGVDLYFLSFSWLNTFVWWPLQAVVGNLAAYNFTVWWSWPLAGFGAYLLAGELFGDRRAAFAAGVIYAFYPYHFAQRNHLNLLSIQWIPFALLFLVRATRRGQLWDGILSGLFFAFAGLSSWHHLTLSGMIGGLWLLYAWLTERREWSRKTWRALLALVATLGLVTGPFLAPLVWEDFANPSGQDPYLGKEGETQTDLLAYFIPNLYHPLWGDLAAPVHRRFLRNKDHAVSLGYVPLILVVYGVLQWRKDRGMRFWLVGLLVFWLLALGPFPRINGEPYPNIPLPYRLIGWSFPVRSLRNPERLNIIVGLCLALVGGASMKNLLRRLSGQRATLGAIALSMLVLLEYWSWPFPTREPGIPDYYYQLAAESGDFAIADLPITNDLSKRYMYYQTVHGKPTVTGHVSRPPADAYDFVASNGLLRAMWQDRRPAPGGDARAELASLTDAGVRYLIVHKDQMSAGQLEALASYLPTSPIVVDDELIVYPTSLP
jgi:hypothetical protein